MTNVGIDFDGTVVTCRERHCALMATAARQLGVWIDVRGWWSHKQSGADSRSALARSGCTLQQADALAFAWERQVELFPWLGFDRVVAGLPASLGRARDTGRAVHLLTARRIGAHLRLQLDQLGLSNHFSSVVVVSHRTAIEDKAAALIRRNCEVYIGDTEADMVSAQAAGIPFIAVASGMRDRRFFEQLGIQRIDEDANAFLSAP